MRSKSRNGVSLEKIHEVSKARLFLVAIDEAVQAGRGEMEHRVRHIPIVAVVERKPIGWLPYELLGVRVRTLV